MTVSCRDIDYHASDCRKRTGALCDCGIDQDMTLAELAAALAPITDDALISHDADVKKLGIVLAAIMGAIAGGGEPDRQVVDALAVHAGLICDHRSGGPGHTRP
jgi:hypothetical protein